MSSQRQEASAGPARGRAATTDRKIVAAVLSLLVHEGPGRVSIESVAAESGVAKTSIYRRYANSTQLLEAALEHTVTATAPLAPDATWEQALTAAVDILLRDMGLGVAITLLQEPHSATAQVLRATVVRPRLDALRKLLQRDKDRGLIRDTVDLDMVVDFILGAAYAHVARYGSLDENWTARVHRAVTDLITTRPAAD